MANFAESLRNIWKIEELRKRILYTLALGGGDLGVALTVTAHAFSKSARQKIEAAGGQTTVVEF